MSKAKFTFIEVYGTSTESAHGFSGQTTRVVNGMRCVELRWWTMHGIGYMWQ